MASVTGAGMAYVMLGVSDIERSTSFYEGTLERPVQFRAGGLAFIDAGPVTIGLSLELGKSREPMVGAVEIVFRVDDVTASWRALAANGVAFIHQPRQINGDDWGATFTDPDGHYLTLLGPQGQ